MRPLLLSLRPAQWAKNFFVLAPLVFAGALTRPALLARGLLAFATFCAAASAVYLVNDLRDREADRRHPSKRHRPLAAGTLGVGTAVGAAVVLAGAALAGALSLGGSFTAFLAAYLGLNLLYSLGLKHVVILDVMLVAAGFLLRVLAGAAAVGAEVSHWLLLCTLFLALFLAFSKRRHEIGLLAAEAAEQRRVLDQYSLAFLDKMINVVTASTVVAYSLYAVSPETVARHGTDRLFWTVPLVLFGVFRYLYLIYQRPGERNPTEAILRDGPFLVNVLLWGLVVVGILYL